MFVLWYAVPAVTGQFVVGGFQLIAVPPDAAAGFHALGFDPVAIDIDGAVVADVAGDGVVQVVARLVGHRVADGVGEEVDGVAGTTGGALDVRVHRRREVDELVDGVIEELENFHRIAGAEILLAQRDADARRPGRLDHANLVAERYGNWSIGRVEALR